MKKVESLEKLKALLESVWRSLHLSGKCLNFSRHSLITCTIARLAYLTGAVTGGPLGPKLKFIKMLQLPRRCT